MAAYGLSPSANEESPQEEQEQSTPSYEDKLAGKLEEGFGQEQQISLQATLALIFGASTHALEIKHSVELLRGEIDVNRLVTDPGYKAEIERAVQLTNRYGRVVKKGDLVDIVPRVETALARVEILHEQTGKVKKDLSPQYEIEMRQAYGLNDEQLKKVREKALEKIKENPKLSMRDALQMEAREFLVKTVEKEVKDDKNIKRSDRKKEIEQRLDAKDKAFLEHPQTAKIYDIEKEFCDKINNRGVESIRETLGQEVQPASPQPISVVPAPPVSIPPPIPLPTAIPAGRGFSFPGFALPSGLTQGLGSMFGGLEKMFGGIGKRLGSVFGKGGALSKAFNLATNLGKQLINRGLDAIAPGLGVAVGKINDAIKAITGIDVEGLIVKGAAVLVGAVAVVTVILPIIIGVGVFSYITGNNPLQLSYSNKRTIGWGEFNKQYLTIENNTLALDSSAPPQNDKKITWQQFEKENLVPQDQLLSLEKPAH